MNATASVLQSQVDALMHRVASDREARIERLRADAAEQSRAIVARARQAARERLRTAITEERRLFERALADRRAALETGTRRADQTTLRELSARAWERLPEALAERWNDGASRREWCDAACAIAARQLRLDDVLVVETDVDAPVELEAQLQQTLTAHALEPAQRLTVEALGPGLRIREGAACVDASLAGLLASRERTEAELLAELERQLGERRGEAA